MKSIKVILNEDVLNLGEEGDVREVAPGYARNYLIPKGLAVPHSKQNLAAFEHRRTSIDQRKEQKRDAAKDLKERLESLSIEIEMPAGDSGKLFGSVTNAVFAERLGQEGVTIERKRIELPGHTIKMTGKYTVLVKLYGEEVAEVPLEVNATGSAGAAKPARKESKAAAEKAPAKEETESNDVAATSAAAAESTTEGAEEQAPATTEDDGDVETDEQQ